MRRITKLSSMLLLLLMTAWTQMFAAGGTEPPFNKTQALKASEIVAGKEIALWVVNTANNWYAGTNDSRSATLTDAVTYIVEDASNGNIYLKRKSDNKYMKYTAANTNASWVATSDEATAFVAKRPGAVEGGDNKTFNYDYATDTNLSTPPSWDPNYEYLVRFAVASTANDTNPIFLNGNSAFANGTGNWSAFLVKDVNVIAYPFTFSDAPSDGQFAANTHWYYLSLRNYYVTYYEDRDYIAAEGTTPTTSYGSFWAFVKTSDGNIEVYNAATGANKVLASTAPIANTDETADKNTGGDETHPSMVEKGQLAGEMVGTWSIKLGDNLFYMKRAGQTEDYYLNYREGALAFWTNSKSAGDAGSQFRVQEVDVANTIATVKENQAAIAGAVGTIGTEDYNKFVTALDKNTMEGLVEALRIRDLEGTPILLDNSKYYRLKNVRRGGYLGLDDTNTNLKCATTLDEKNASQLWKITKNADNTVKLFHANAQKNVEQVPQTSGTGLSIGLTEEGANYTFKEWSTTQYGFNINGHYLVESNDNGAMGSWNEGGVNSDHAWYLIPAEDIELDITDAGYATVNYPFAVQVPSEVTAYTGTSEANKGVFTLKKIEGGIVPANTPVVLSGAEGTYSLNILANNTDAALGSDLKGTLLSEEIEGTTNAYIMAKGNSGVGFYQMNDNDRTLGANKAYIILPEEANYVRSIIFSDGQTTGIESTVAEGTETEEYYDLQGRRVMNPTKGIFVTKSGKKVLINK